MLEELPRKMTLAEKSILLVYLLSVGCLAAYFEWSIWQKKDMTSSDLILIAATSGALGAFVHAITSFVTFLGNRTLLCSWFGWYLARPVIGAAYGLMFFFVLSAGLSNGTATFNPFGVAAICSFAGLFSKQASHKLKDIFDSVVAAEKPSHLRDGVEKV